MTPVRELLVEFAKLDLGSKPESYPCAPCGPCEKPRRYFPTVYISEQDNPVDIPDEGTATIEYKVRGRSMNERDGKKRHSADIEIRTIESGKQESRKEPKEGGAAVLLKTPVTAAMEDLRAVVELARGDVILRNLDKLPAKTAKRITGSYDSFKPILQRDLPGHRTQIKKHIWPSGGGLFRKKEVDRMAGSGLRHERDKLASQIRKGRGENRVAAMAAADIAKAKRKIGFSRDTGSGMRDARSLLRELIELDSRPRNNNGQFVGSETGGADPDSMHAAYGPGTVAKAAGLGAVAGAGAVGGLQIRKARKALSALAR